MATVHEIDHDSSTTIGDFYDTVTDPNGAFTVTPTAALNGTTNGVLIDYDAGASIPILRDSFTALTGTDLRFRIRLKLSAFSTTAVINTVAAQFDLRNNSDIMVFQFSLTSDGSNGFLVEAFSSDDNANIESISGSGEAVSSSDEICLEIRAIRETADGNADGIAEFYIDGVSQGSLSDIDNFNRWNDGLDTVRNRFLSNNPAFTDDLYYDEWILDDDNAVSLCPVAFTGNRILVEAIDQATAQTIYLTTWEDGTLYLYNRALNDLSQVGIKSFGSAVSSDLTARSKYIAPYAPLFPDVVNFGDYIYVYGRWDDGSVKHLALSTDGGTGTFGSNLGDASWGSDWVSGFLADDENTFFAFVNGSSRALWRSTDGGLSWTSLSSLPFDVDPGGVSKHPSGRILIINRNTGAAMAAYAEAPDYSSWIDATGSPNFPTAGGGSRTARWIT